jgi:hypothetical protein
MLAYFDSFAGLVPCRLLAVGDFSDSGSLARIRITAARGPYRRGDLETVSLRRVVPRAAVYRRAGATYIRPHTWPRALAPAA